MKWLRLNFNERSSYKILARRFFFLIEEKPSAEQRYPNFLYILVNYYHMLYLYYGNNAPLVRQKAFGFAHSLSEDEIIGAYVTAETYTEGAITDLAKGASLFGGTEVVIIDTISEDVSVFEQILEQLELMASSRHHFVMIEGVLRASEKKNIQTHAKNTEEIVGASKEKFNTFLLTEAFLRRDKKSLWLLLTEAWRAGVTNEEIIGVLFWQVKILRLVEKTKSAEEAGQKPFVYSKAKRALGNFKKGELDIISQNLLSIYHEGHLGKGDTALMLEKWVLGL